MNKFLLALAGLMVIPCFLACVRYPRGIIEGEGFRLVRNGQTLWEMMSTDNGGVSIKFLPSGKQVCRIGVFDNAVSCKCEVGGAVSEFVITDGAYSDGASVDGGKVTMGRVITKVKHDREQVKQDREYECANIIRTPTSEATTKVSREMVSKYVRAGIGEATFEVTDNEATWRSKVRDDVKLDLQVGGDIHHLTCRGKLVSGFVMDLVNEHGKWSWANDK
jgi:hypothetical protein